MGVSDGSPGKGRAAEALRALSDGEQLARRRIWGRVREGVTADLRRRHRRRWAAIWSGVAAAFVVVALTPALVAGIRNNSSDGQQALSGDDVASQAVMQMLAAQTSNGGSEGTEEFVLYLVTEAQAAAQ